MSANGNNEGGAQPVGAKDDEEAYRAGYQRTIREAEFVLSSYGWSPTERQLVLALTRTVAIYSAARQGKPVSGKHPEWLRGCADAIRELLRQQAGCPPSGI